ncbi:sel1 repeat family protein, partial [Acinetobacter sp. SCC474]|nr:sel1 repeat family protein [Acinetobacter pollinis]
GVQQNYQQAFYWLYQAAKQGLDQAQYNLGLMYKNGLGVEQSYMNAYVWFNAAAEQGFDQAKLEVHSSLN